MRFHSPEDTFTDSAVAYAETEKIIESISDRMQKGQAKAADAAETHFSDSGMTRFPGVSVFKASDRDYADSVRAAESIVSCSCDDHKK